MSMINVRSYERVAKFRLGKFKGIVGPGLHWLWPLVDKALTIDLRERLLVVPQRFATNSLGQVDVTVVIYYHVMEHEVARLVRNKPSPWPRVSWSEEAEGPEVVRRNPPPWPSRADVYSIAQSALSYVIGDATTYSSLDDLRHIGGVLRSRLETGMRRLALTVTRGSG